MKPSLTSTTAPTRHVVLGVLAMLLVAALDWVTGRDLGLSLSYAVPIFAVSRSAGDRAGLVTAVAGSLLWGFSDAFAGEPYVPRTEIGRGRRHGHFLTVGYVDCDDFKAVNDARGHVAGDALLREVARVLATSVRAADVVGRIGGDEFVLLMPEIGPEQAREAAARLRRELDLAMQASRWPVTFSMGLATFRPPPPELEALLLEADGLMYAAKRSGKDSIRHGVFPPPEPD